MRNNERVETHNKKKKGFKLKKQNKEALGNPNEMRDMRVCSLSPHGLHLNNIGKNG